MQVQGQNSGGKLASRWAEFLQKTALSVGSLLLASSVISWIAANWAYATKVQKLAGTQGLLVLLALMTAWLLYYRPSPRPNFSASAYSAGLASVCLGGLLALVGQIYQTGADPWQLFLLWALLLVSWLVSVHTVILGLLVALLINIAAVLYFDALSTSIWRWITSSQLSMAALMVLINLLMLAAWESALRYLDDRWRIGPRVLGGVLVAWVVWVNLTFTLGYAVLGLALFAGLIWFYKQRRRDVAMLAWCALGISSIVAIQLISRINGMFGLLGVIVVLIALSGWVLKYLVREVMQSDKTAAAKPEDFETPEEQEAQTLKPAIRISEPWYIILFRVSAMLLTALLLLLYFFTTWNLTVDRVWPVGLVIVAVGVLTLRKGSTGGVYEAGATLVCTGLFMVGVGVVLLDMVPPYWRGLGLLVLGALVYALSHGFAVRWISTIFCLTLALAITWPEQLWHNVWWNELLSAKRASGFYFSAYLRVWWLAVFAILVLVASTKSARHERWSPLAWALIVVTQSATFVLPSVGLDVLSGYWADQFSLMLLVFACSLLPVVALATLLWSVQGVSAIVRIGAPLALAVACVAWMGAPGVSLGLLWLILGFAYKRRTVMGFGALSVLVYLGVYYYQLEISLLHKSWLLGATGLWLLASWWVLRSLVRGQRTQGADHRDRADFPRPRLWPVAGVLGGLLLILAVVNNGIYQREKILSTGASVVLELAPVDPRSLMQGDYMTLNFNVVHQVWNRQKRLPDDVQTAIQERGLAYMVLVPDDQGVHRLFGMQIDLDGPVFTRVRQMPDEPTQWIWETVEAVPAKGVVMEFRIRDWRVKLATDAWFFPEGQAEHFEQARYGEFKVSDRGVGLLKDMLDQELVSLSVR
ncbi:GDYXXLXY domain-containing protein [Alcaligenaceae bacterium]|nr:GDYXXLXY domain-containing protein [Alcaligenaceae bacterium]